MTLKLKLESFSEPAMIGRSKELQELNLILKAVTEGKGCTVFISGEAGSGKTRIATEFLTTAKAQNISVLSGWCLSNAAIPYFPFLEAFNSYASNAHNRSLSSQLSNVRNSLISNIIGGEETLNPQAWKDQTFNTVASELLDISTQKPLILFIDDLQWADSASISLMQYLAHIVMSEKILLLATYRSEEIYSSPEAQRHPLKETFRLMARDNLFQEIKLENLNQADVGKVIESMLGGKAHQSFIEKLAADSQGLPLFLVESIRMLLEEHKITTDGQQWCLNATDLRVPAKIKDIILRRVEALEVGQRRILNVAAVVGEQFDPKLVALVVGKDSIDVLESLDSMAMSTLLVYGKNDSYWFSHSKYREMLYEEIPPLRRKEYHLRIAQATEDAIKIINDLPVSNLAYHYVKAGDKQKSLKYSILAGNDALTKFSNDEAIEYFTFVLNMGSSDSIPSTMKMSAMEGLGEAFFGSGKFEQATETFEELALLTEGKTKLRAYRRAMDSAFFEGKFTKLLTLTQKAEEYSSFDRLENARVLMNRARATMFLGNRKAGLADFESALQVFEEENSMSDIARVLLGLGGASNRHWTPEKGLANALRALLYFQQLGDLRGLADAYNRAGQSFGYRLLNKQALAMNEEAISVGVKIMNYSRVAESYVSIGKTYEILNRYSDALEASLEALKFAQKTSSAWTLAMVYANLVIEYSKLDQIVLAEQYFSMLTSMPKEAILNAFVRFNACKSTISLAREQWSQAIEYSQEILAPVDPGINPSTELMARRDYAKALEETGLSDEAHKQMVKAKQLVSRLQRAFEHARIYPFLLAPKHLGFEDRLSIRLDLINVSSKPAEIIGIEGLTPKGLNICDLSSNSCYEESDVISVHPKTLGAFESASVTISFKPKEAGFFTFYPQIRYYDELRKIRKCELNPNIISISPPAGKPKETTCAYTPIAFSSLAAESAFQYLLHSFNHDLKQKISMDRAGWRTLMDIARNTKITKHSLYEFSHRRGKPLSELERLRLVESKYFLGERGRGGRVLKVRICADSQAVIAHLK